MARRGPRARAGRRATELQPAELKIQLQASPSCNLYVRWAKSVLDVLAHRNDVTCVDGLKKKAGFEIFFDECFGAGSDFLRTFRPYGVGASYGNV